MSPRSKLPGCIPPPLPEKTASGRFEAEFVEQRMMDLQRFINKMANNPLVQPLPELTAFLTETSNAVWDNRAAWYEKGTVAKVMSSMSSWFNQVRTRPPSPLGPIGLLCLPRLRIVRRSKFELTSAHAVLSLLALYTAVTRDQARVAAREVGGVTRRSLSIYGGGAHTHCALL